MVRSAPRGLQQPRKAPKPLAHHRRIEDRFLAPLRPRRELLEALWNFAIWKTDKRRRKAGAVRVPILRVAVWCQLSQEALIARYRAHLKYLGIEHPITRRTLTRQLAAFRALELVNVTQPRYYDTKRRAWVQEHNVYAFTRAGILWIKKHARAVKIPPVV